MFILFMYMLWIIGAIALGYIYYLIVLTVVAMVSPNEMFPGFEQYKVVYWILLSIFAYPQARKLLSK